jgi:signal transduction histidine kinase
MIKTGSTDRVLRRLGPHYILAMMLATRLSGSVAAVLVVYYVNLTLKLPAQVAIHFHLLASLVVSVTVALTVLLALWETRCLRRVLRQLHRGEPVEPEEGARAGRDAVLFPARHHSNEARLIPVTTIVPLLLLMRLIDGAPVAVLTNITLACGMGIGLALMITFFLIERGMAPVIRLLLDHGVPVPYDHLPVSKLRSRMNLCFSLIILIMALMIGTLARQRAADIIEDPDNQAEAVSNLRAHTTYITIAAVTLGFVLSRVLAHSIASRVANLVEAMRRVGQGQFSERVVATGNDEIDVLARQFNAMVGQLDHSHQTIRDLNVNLEHKVKRRTRQLSRSKQALQDSLDQLQEYDRLKTEFFSNVSHELRTPLTMILSPVDQMLERHGERLPAEAIYMLDVVRVNGRRLLELINRLLEFSKLEAGRAKLGLSAVDVNGLVQRLVAAATPLAGQRGVRLEIECDPAVPVLGADEEKIDTITTNLVSNALKFTPAGGSVHVRTRLTGDRVVVAVRDTGIGIAPEDQGRIFQRFVQLDGSTSREFAGTGLGLALAKELVELHGGQIHLDSAPGQGSSFWFELPLTPAPAESAARPVGVRSRFADLVTCGADPSAADAAPLELPADAPRILVVDDTPELRAHVRSILADQYHVLTARDGLEGLDVARCELPDLIISDVMMPGIDGHELCRCLKQEPATSRTPFIMLTARTEKSMKIEGLDCGAEDYLVKPFDADELRARVRSLLRVHGLHRMLDQRNTELETTLKELRATQTRLVELAHRAGMAEIATGVLHNIGNVLNSVNVSISTLDTRVREMRVGGPARVAALLAEHAEDAGDFLRSDPRGRKLPEYLGQLSETLAAEQQHVLTELDFLRTKLQDIRNIINAQQKYARQLPFKEPVQLHAVIADVLVMSSRSLTKHRIEVVRDLEELPVVAVERLKLVQVLDNLVRNAIDAMKGEEGPPRTLTIQLRRGGPCQASIRVKDTGRGIEPEHLQRIFNYGFTTKPAGNGFGLHSAANAMTEIGGTIRVDSDGPGRGATFTIEFPLPGLPAPGAAEADHAGPPADVPAEMVCA